MRQVIAAIAAFFPALAIAQSVSFDVNLALAEQRYEAIFDKFLERPRSWGTDDWGSLIERADEGHVPLFYLLAEIAYPMGSAVSRRLNARGYVGLLLTTKNCRTNPRGPWGVILEAMAHVYAVRRDRKLWLDEFRVALADTRAYDPRAPSATWYCGPGNVLSPDDASRARFKYLMSLRDIN